MCEGGRSEGDESEGARTKVKMIQNDSTRKSPQRMCPLATPGEPRIGHKPGW